MSNILYVKYERFCQERSIQLQLSSARIPAREAEWKFWERASKLPVEGRKVELRFSASLPHCSHLLPMQLNIKISASLSKMSNGCTVPYIISHACVILYNSMSLAKGRYVHGPIRNPLREESRVKEKRY